MRNNLVIRFSVVSFAVIVAIAVMLASVLSAKIRSDAVDHFVNEAVKSASWVTTRALIPQDLNSPMAGGRYERFDNFVQSSVISDSTARIKLWARDGTVIYSNDPSQVGEKFPKKENLLKALKGEIPIEIKTPKDTDNDKERHLGTLMEIYTPIVFPGTNQPAGSLEI